MNRVSELSFRWIWNKAEQLEIPLQPYLPDQKEITTEESKQAYKNLEKDWCLRRKLFLIKSKVLPLKF